MRVLKLLLLGLQMDGKLTFIDHLLKRRWLTHLIFWVIILIIQSQVFLFSGRTFILVLVNSLALLPSILLAAYFLSYYQIPKLVFKKKYVSFIISLLISSYLFTALARLMVVFVAEPLIGVEELTPWSEMLQRIFFSPDRLLRNYLFSIYLGPIIMAIIKLIKLRNEEKSRIEALEGEKSITELNLLKTQIHPHFLLNTLNNIYALALKKSDEAPESVLKLSEMLTYVLYKCNDRYVLLENELTLLDNYIALEKLRYGSELEIEFIQSVHSKGLRIAPLILLSVVENAFKHGVSGDVERPVIKIRIDTSVSQIVFSVFNTRNPIRKAANSSTLQGIGSLNIRKQLELIYPGDHELNVVENEQSYEMKIVIYLTDEIHES